MEKLWKAKDIAEYFGVKYPDRIMAQPDFPKAIKLDGIGRRWEPEEVREYARKKRAA